MEYLRKLKNAALYVPKGFRTEWREIYSKSTDEDWTNLSTGIGGAIGLFGGIGLAMVSDFGDYRFLVGLSFMAGVPVVGRKIGKFFDRRERRSRLVYS